MRRSRAIAVVGFVLVLLGGLVGSAGQPAEAQVAGAPVPGFGGSTGQASAPASDPAVDAVAAAVQADGRILAVTLQGGTVVRVNRFATDGSPDLSYGPGGTSASAALPAGVAGAFLQNDGKLVLLGADASVRLTTGGLVDPSWPGNDATGGAAPTAVVQRSDGSHQFVLPAGPNENGRIAALAADGSLGGSVLLDAGSVGGQGSVAPQAAVYDPVDDRLVVVGSHGDQVFVGEYDSAGALVAGRARAADVPVPIVVRTAAVAADGGVYAIGTAILPGQFGFPAGTYLAVAKFLEHGGIDITYGTSGVAVIGPAGSVGAASVDGDRLLVSAGFLRPLPPGVTTPAILADHTGIIAVDAGGRADTRFAAKGFLDLQLGGPVVTVPAAAGVVAVGGCVNAPCGRVHVRLLTRAFLTSGTGYRFAAADGGVFTFGDAGFAGSLGGVRLNRPIVGVASTPSGNGYWMVASDGGIFTFGDAPFLGSLGAVRLNRPIVAMARTPSGHGYWLVASDGGTFTFGDAGFFGSLGSIPLNRPIVAAAATPSGGGYWLLGDDGGVFTFGDAPYLGGGRGTDPSVGIAAVPSGLGYRILHRGGSVEAYGTAQHLGDLAGLVPNAPLVAIATSPDGQGYVLVDADGGAFPFGDAPGLGGLSGSTHLARPVVAAAA